jgi:hypothetical protein
MKLIIIQVKIGVAQIMRSPEKFKGIYVDETSPSNPFGPNYFSLPYNAKLAYKFNKMKAFIRPTKQDLLKK